MEFLCTDLKSGSVSSAVSLRSQQLFWDAE